MDQSVAARWCGRLLATVLAASLPLASCTGGTREGQDAGRVGASASSESERTAAVGTPSDTASSSTASPSGTTSVSTTAPPSDPPTPRRPGLAPVPESPPPPEPVHAGGRVARALSSTGSCDPERPAQAVETLTWRPSGAGVQRVAVATRPDGFDSGRYGVTDPLPAARDTYAVSPVEPGGIYYWRILTADGDGWAASAVASFTGVTCIDDSPPSP